MSDYILEMNHITKEFSGVKALDDVNLKVRQGEIHGLCGENGAGKSTLMNVLSGVYPHGTYSGDIVYKGDVCKFKDLKESEAKGIVIIHQELALSPLLSVAENVFIGNEQTNVKGVIDWTETRRKAQEMLVKVGLEHEDVNVPVNSLGVFCAGRCVPQKSCSSLTSLPRLLMMRRAGSSLTSCSILKSRE